jgi:hypothetical protein
MLMILLKDADSLFHSLIHVAGILIPRTRDIFLDLYQQFNPGISRQSIFENSLHINMNLNNNLLT